VQTPTLVFHYIFASPNQSYILKLSVGLGFENEPLPAFYCQMIWDLILLSVIMYNVAHCAQRGGRAVGISFFAFLFAYVVTILLTPAVASLVSARSPLPVPITTFVCMIAIYLLAKRPTKAFLRRRFLPDHDSVTARHSSRTGAGLGFVRGVMVATAFAIIGTGFARIQNVGHFSSLPDIESSLGVRAADELMGLAIERYTRNAGPTTRQLIDYSRFPKRETLDAILNGPFVTRLKTSDPVRALQRDQEFLGLVRERKAAPILLHPTFLRAVGHAVSELEREEPTMASHLP
jgi:uncharacterized membrane protein (UPF0136 family)